MDVNEFSIIDRFFKNQAMQDPSVIIGIGDDAACLDIPDRHQLLVSTDTLVQGVHFLKEWDAYDIAWRSVMVNVSDIAAMGGVPRWVSLALCLPDYCETWLSRFAQGLASALQCYQIVLIGGDTTRGPLTITLTIQGTVLANQAISRSGAKVGDGIWVSGELGAAALAVSLLPDGPALLKDKKALMDKLLHPVPRLDLNTLLHQYASAAIDISDGLAADLYHICERSGVGASIHLADIPIHPLVKKYQVNPLEMALSGGDDYELCFCAAKEFSAQIRSQGCYYIGTIEQEPGLRAFVNGSIIDLPAKGYSHF